MINEGYNYLPTAIFISLLAYGILAVLSIAYDKIDNEMLYDALCSEDYAPWHWSAYICLTLLSAIYTLSEFSIFSSAKESTNGPYFVYKNIVINPNTLSTHSDIESGKRSPPSDLIKSDFDYESLKAEYEKLKKEF